jgi:hypothetical protein
MTISSASDQLIGPQHSWQFSHSKLDIRAYI